MCAETDFSWCNDVQCGPPAAALNITAIGFFSNDFGTAEGFNLTITASECTACSVTFGACLNGGSCISNDTDLTDMTAYCECPIAIFGTRCEIGFLPEAFVREVKVLVISTLALAFVLLLLWLRTKCHAAHQCARLSSSKSTSSGYDEIGYQEFISSASSDYAQIVYERVEPPQPPPIELMPSKPPVIYDNPPAVSVLSWGFLESDNGIRPDCARKHSRLSGYTDALSNGMFSPSELDDVGLRTGSSPGYEPSYPEARSGTGYSYSD